MGSIKIISVFTSILLTGMCCEVSADEFITFDVKGATYTIPQAINSTSTIAGSFGEDALSGGSFIRAPDGTITTFQKGSGFTDPYDIDAKDIMVGTITRVGGPIFGFRKDIDTRQFKKFPKPTNCSQAVYATTLNDKGAVAGYCYDANGPFHGFLRTSDGRQQTFDTPDAGTTQGRGTYGYSINERGEIAGVYIDSNSAIHGYVRSRSGVFSEFDVAGAGNGTSQGTQPSSINNDGDVTGSYVDTNNIFHGFIRKPGGKVVKFDPPGAGGYGTLAREINNGGFILGYYAAAEDGHSHCFVRSPDGSFITFSAPGAIDTLCARLNDSNVITGLYSDGGIDHGFLRFP